MNRLKLTNSKNLSQLPQVTLAKNPKDFLTSRLTNRTITDISEQIVAQAPRRRFNSYHQIRPRGQEESITKINYKRELLNNSEHLSAKPHFKRQRFERNHSQQQPRYLPKITHFMSRIEDEVKQINTVLKAHIEATNELVQNKMTHIIGQIQRYNSIRPYQEQNQHDSQQSSEEEYVPLSYKNYHRRNNKFIYKKLKQSQPPPAYQYTRFSKERIEKLTSKWRKCGNAILFIIYLRRFCRKMREGKQNMSEKIFQKLPTYVGIFRQMLEYNLKHFAEVLYSKRDISFEVLKEDSQEVGKQKIQLTRKIINILLRGLQTAFKNNTGNNQITKLLYVICKHGNLCNRRGLLTKQELQVSCISPAFKSMSANHHLQKIALINFIFIKVMIYRMFFTEQKLSQAMKQENTPRNIYLLGSILYALAIQLQNDILENVPESYKLGNFVQYANINTMASMAVGNSEYKRGQLLSGLKDRNWVKVVYRIGGWESQSKILRQIIQIAYQTIVKFHEVAKVKLIK